MRNFKVVTFFAWGLLSALHAQAVEPLSVQQLLSKVYAENPEISAMEARALSEKAVVRSRYWLTDPKVGLMHENALNDMEVREGPMNFWTVSQDVSFPTKYLAMGKAQSARAKATEQEALDKKLEIRQKALTAYFNLYTASRMLDLLEAQRETLREVARVAEARRATGSVPQQDEMKAHVEQTKLESQVLLQQQEFVGSRAELNALLNRDPGEEVAFNRDDVHVPKLTKELDGFSKLATFGSKAIASAQFWVDEASQQKSLATQGYFPDFTLNYRKPYLNAPDGAYAASFEMTIPLWFFMKQTSEVSSASARKIEAEKNLEKVSRSVQADAEALASRTAAYSKLLTIYETALIPQATSTLDSSRAAYSAGRTTFLELLDSERSLYSVRIEFYGTLAKFVEALTQLERVAGTSLSNLPI